MQLTEIKNSIQELESVDISTLASILSHHNIDWEDYPLIFQAFKNLQEVKGFDSHLFDFLPFLNLARLHHLEIISSERSGIQTPPNFPHWHQLKTLSLIFNQAHTIPDEILKATQVSTLKLKVSGGMFEGTGLGNLDKLTQLTSLELPKRMPKLALDTIEGVFQLTQLEYLDVSGIKAKTIAQHIGQLKNLKQIHLRLSSQEQVVLENLSQLKNLEQFKSKFIAKIPECLAQLQKLHTFRLKVNDIFKLNTQILQQLPHLRTLELYFETNISEDLLQLTQVTHLHLLHHAQFDIMATFEILRRMPHLEGLSIYIASNQEDTTVKYLGAMPHLKELTVMCDHHINLKKMFESLHRLENLQSLTISGPRDFNIPPQLPGLSQLQSIQIHSIAPTPSNQLHYFQYLAKLPKLTHLHITDEEIMPHELGAFIKLKHLSIGSETFILESERLKKALPHTKITY